MKIRRHSYDYNFIGDTYTGITFRWGQSFKTDPFFAPWPELADISISNHCSNNCSFCYRDSNLNNSFISMEEYEYILNSLQHQKWGNVFQVAIGGGEPLEHPNFLKLLELTKAYNIVPNFTTNGKLLSKEIIQSIKGKVGAIAISIVDIYDLCVFR